MLVGRNEIFILVDNGKKACRLVLWICEVLKEQPKEEAYSSSLPVPPIEVPSGVRKDAYFVANRRHSVLLAYSRNLKMQSLDDHH